jgi:DNA-directed RNA polymerase specialized sigma24 family protein
MNGSVLEGASSIGDRAAWSQTESVCSARCRTTRWSVVLAAASGGAKSRAALSLLYRAYWQPVFSFIARRRGAQVAAELAQEFFFERMVDGGDLKRLEKRPEQRFRGWLFTALKSFLKNQWKYEHRMCRDSTKTLSWSDAVPGDGSTRTTQLVASSLDPERQLERARALALLSRVLARLRREYCAHAALSGVDGAGRFEALKVFLPGPNTEDADYTDRAAALGLSPDAVKQIVRRLRVRFADLLNETLRRSVSSDADVALARRALCQALESPAPEHDGA